MDKCCENCTFAHDIVGDGLAWCSKDKRSKDYDMCCDSFSYIEKDISDILDWLHEVIDKQGDWKQFYSDSEVKLLAEKTRELMVVMKEVNKQ